MAWKQPSYNTVQRQQPRCIKCYRVVSECYCSELRAATVLGVIAAVTVGAMLAALFFSH